MTILAIYLICLGLVWAFVRGANDRTSHMSEMLRTQLPEGYR